MGSITKLGEKWRAQICVDGVRKSKVFPRKGDARFWLDETERQLSTSSSKTLYDAFDRYTVTRSAAKKGHKWEVFRIGGFRSHFHNVPISDISKADISDWRDERSKSVKSSTINREFNLLSSIFSEAVEWEWIAKNPCSEVRRPAQPPHRNRIFSSDEIELICLALDRGEKSQAVRDVFKIALETGMRSGEIIRIKRSDISGNTLLVPESKNGKPRVVPLSKAAVELLERCSLPFDLTDAVRDALFRKAVRRCGIDNAHFHDARRTAASRLSHILTPQQLARMLGHSSLSFIMIYYHENPEDIAAKLG